MPKDYSADEFFRFMDYLRDKHLMKPATVRSRRVSAKKMLDVLEEDEKQDLRKINVDELHERFIIKHGMDFTPSSRQVYKSRFKSAVSDFLRFVEDPSFKPSVVKRDTGGPLPIRKKGRGKEKSVATNPAESNSSAPPGTIVFPVPLRPELVVELRGIPSDMTEQEADKIAAVVKALAQK